MVAQLEISVVFFWSEAVSICRLFAKSVSPDVNVSGWSSVSILGTCAHALRHIEAEPHGTLQGDLALDIEEFPKSGYDGKVTGRYYTMTHPDLPPDFHVQLFSCSF